MRGISSTPIKTLPRFRRLQEGFRQSVACGTLGDHETLQHQLKPHPHHATSTARTAVQVYLNGDTGVLFQTTVGVRKGCLLSPTLFNIFLERIIADALEDHQGTVGIGSRIITKLRFADDIDGLADSK